ncbi:hypothetical protein VTK56DRAFT_4691 [Thermocarpiscus australiensis]
MTESTSHRHAFATFRPDNYPSRVIFSGVIDHIGQRASSVENYRHAKFLAPDSEGDKEKFVLSLDVPGGGPAGAWRLGRGSKPCQAQAQCDGDCGVDPPGAACCAQRAGTDDAGGEARGTRTKPYCQSACFGVPSSRLRRLDPAVDKQKMQNRVPCRRRSHRLKTGTGAADGPQPDDKPPAFRHLHVRSCLRSGQPPDSARLEFVAARNDYITTLFGRADLPHPRLDPLPLTTHQRFRHVIAHRTIAASRLGTVKCGVDASTGDPVALKTLTLTGDSENRCRINRLLYMAAKFLPRPPSKNKPTLPAPGPPLGVLPILAIWCEHGQDLTAEFDETEDAFRGRCDVEVEQVHLAMPLARYDFASLPWDRLSYLDRLSLFHDTLSGIGAMHSRGLMHRAVTTKKLLVLSLDSPTAVVCGLGNATTHEVSATIDGFAPWHTMAPEITT